MSTPKWAIGMKRIGAGLYVDGNGGLHIDTPVFCESHGYEPTPENIEMLERAARDLFPGVEVQLEEKT